MAKMYKVWIDVEEHDLETNIYKTLDLPFASVRVFYTEREARAFADALQDTGEVLKTPPCPEDCGREEHK